MEEKKFTKGESEDEIKTWSEEFEKHLEKADQATNRIQSEIQAIDMEEQEKRAFDNHKQQMEFEREILEQKAEFQKNLEQQKAATQATEECKSSPQIIHHEVQWKDRRVAPVLGEIRFRNRFH